MKLILISLFLSSAVFGQNLSPEEQQKLIEENKALKEQLSKGATPSIDPAQATMIMEKLKQGQKLQEEQQEALKELDEE